MASEIDKGPDGLLDRIFALMVKELELADPRWCQAIALGTLNADTLRDAWFEDRKKHGPFTWAEANLKEVERNKREKRTVAWRYTVLRLHEVVQAIVPSLNEHDRERFKSGLERVFIDNYAAIPPQSIRRLLALREAGIISVVALGDDYDLDIGSDQTVITTAKKVTASTCLSTRADKSRSETRTFASPPCVNSLREPAMTFRTWGKTIRCWRRHHCGGVSLLGRSLADARSSVCSGFV